jgi:hypothetical protein
VRQGRAEFGGKLHEQGLPEETSDKRHEIAVQLAATMVRDGMSRELGIDGVDAPAASVCQSEDVAGHSRRHPWTR